MSSSLSPSSGRNPPTPRRPLSRPPVSRGHRGRGSGEAATEDAAVASSARHDKESKYPELATSQRCKLIVIALETGGRFSAEAFAFLEELDFAKAREAPTAVRKSARLAWQRRWVRLLACTAARAWCHAATAPAGELPPQADDRPLPDWHEVVCSHD